MTPDKRWIVYLDSILQHRRHGLDISTYTEADLNELEELSKKNRTEGLADTDVMRYRQIITIAESR